MKYGLQIQIYSKEAPPLVLKVAVSEELANVIDKLTITGALFVTEQFIPSVGVPSKLPILGTRDFTDGKDKITEVNNDKKDNKK